MDETYDSWKRWAAVGTSKEGGGLENFTYLTTVGEGAYAVVYQCEDNRTGEHVAVKFFKQAHEHRKVLALAVREIRVLKTCQHVNIVRLLDAFTTNSGRVYMVFPYGGRSAHRVLRSCPEGRGLPPEQIKSLAWQLLQALTYLHGRKIVHRDVKPANILLADDGCVRLCDFGFARRTRCGPFEAERLSSYVFTRWYRAPEVLVGDVYGPAADIWSLGCTLAEMAIGAPLFPGRSTMDQLYLIMRCFGPLGPDQSARLAADPGLRSLTMQPLTGRSLRQRLPPGLSAGLVALVEACLQPDPRVRPTAEELLQMPWAWGVSRALVGNAQCKGLGVGMGMGQEDGGGAQELPGEEQEKDEAAEEWQRDVKQPRRVMEGVQRTTMEKGGRVGGCTVGSSQEQEEEEEEGAAPDAARMITERQEEVPLLSGNMYHSSNGGEAAYPPAVVSATSCRAAMQGQDPACTPDSAQPRLQDVAPRSTATSAAALDAAAGAVVRVKAITPTLAAASGIGTPSGSAFSTTVAAPAAAAAVPATAAPAAVTTVDALCRIEGMEASEQGAGPQPPSLPPPKSDATTAVAAGIAAAANAAAFGPSPASGVHAAPDPCGSSMNMTQIRFALSPLPAPRTAPVPIRQQHQQQHHRRQEQHQHQQEEGEDDQLASAPSITHRGTLKRSFTASAMLTAGRGPAAPAPPAVSTSPLLMCSPSLNGATTADGGEPRLQMSTPAFSGDLSLPVGGNWDHAPPSATASALMARLQGGPEAPTAMTPLAIAGTPGPGGGGRSFGSGGGVADGLWGQRWSRQSRKARLLQDGGVAVAAQRHVPAASSLAGQQLPPLPPRRMTFSGTAAEGGAAERHRLALSPPPHQSRQQLPLNQQEQNQQPQQQWRRQRYYVARSGQEQPLTEPEWQRGWKGGAGQAPAGVNDESPAVVRARAGPATVGARMLQRLRQVSSRWSLSGAAASAAAATAMGHVQAPVAARTPQPHSSHRRQTQPALQYPHPHMHAQQTSRQSMCAAPPSPHFLSSLQGLLLMRPTAAAATRASSPGTVGNSVMWSTNQSAVAAEPQEEDAEGFGLDELEEEEGDEPAAPTSMPLPPLLSQTGAFAPGGGGGHGGSMTPGRRGSRIFMRMARWVSFNGMKETAAAATMAVTEGGEAGQQQRQKGRLQGAEQQERRERSSASCAGSGAQHHHLSHHLHLGLPVLAGPSPTSTDSEAAAAAAASLGPAISAPGAAAMAARAALSPMGGGGGGAMMGGRSSRRRVLPIPPPLSLPGGTTGGTGGGGPQSTASASVPVSPHGQHLLPHPHQQRPYHGYPHSQPLTSPPSTGPLSPSPSLPVLHGQSAYRAQQAPLSTGLSPAHTSPHAHPHLQHLHHQCPPSRLNLTSPGAAFSPLTSTDNVCTASDLRVCRSPRQDASSPLAAALPSHVGRTKTPAQKTLFGDAGAEGDYSGSRDGNAAGDASGPVLRPTQQTANAAAMAAAGTAGGTRFGPATIEGSPVISMPLPLPTIVDALVSAEAVGTLQRPNGVGGRMSPTAAAEVAAASSLDAVVCGGGEVTAGGVAVGTPAGGSRALAVADAEAASGVGGPAAAVSAATVGSATRMAADAAVLAVLAPPVASICCVAAAGVGAMANYESNGGGGSLPALSAVHNCSDRGGAGCEGDVVQAGAMLAAGASAGASALEPAASHRAAEKNKRKGLFGRLVRGLKGAFK